jgi:hypothetical protein
MVEDANKEIERMEEEKANDIELYQMPPVPKLNPEEPPLEGEEDVQEE